MLGGGNVSGKSEKAVEIPLNKGAKGFASAVAKIRQLQGRPDIIHAHSLPAVVFGIAVKIRFNLQPKLVYTFHWAVPPSWFKRAGVAVLQKMIDSIHVYSEEAKGFLSESYGITSDRIQLAYVGVDHLRFAGPPESREYIRRELGFSEDKLILLYVGRLAPEKGIPHLLTYLRNTDRMDVKAVIVGSGDQEGELRAIVKRWQIEERVDFVPYTTRVEDFYRAADLLVLPSVSLETFGLVVVEAALCGLPAVRSDLPGASDQILDGETGFVYSPPQPGALAEKLDQILSGEYDLVEIGRRARNHALGHFTYETMYQAMLELYRRA